MIRIAIIDKNLCKPNKCNKQCKRKCPVTAQGKECVTVTNKSKFAIISENMCIGCGICSNVCPFKAIKIYNLPTELENNLVHSYGLNSFKLYKMLVPKINTIQGLLGPNGIGKSTMINIMNKNIIPFSDEKYLLNMFKGTELSKYLISLYQEKLIIKTKPQNIDTVFNYFKRNERKNIKVNDEVNKYFNNSDNFHNNVRNTLLFDILDKNVCNLSGGQMQKFLCGIIFLTTADVYIFDEFTNYLDIQQRILIANLIQELKNINKNKYIIVIDHDISILDYTCDTINIIYGKSSAYGIISSTYNCQEAVNIFFNGYIPADNMRFRTEPFTFRFGVEYENENENDNDNNKFININEMSYPTTIVNYDNKMYINIEGSKITPNTTYIVLGKNGTGKTTFLSHIINSTNMICSYKMQHTNYSNFDEITVRDYLLKKIRKSMADPIFIANVVTNFISDLYERNLNELSGGEAQKVSIVECLGTDSDVYLLDEPSANLDVEQRYWAIRIIKKFLLDNKKIGFIVEHDIMMAMQFYQDINSNVILVESENNNNIINTVVSEPLNYMTGMNKFLKSMNITFRTEIRHKRPRINKRDSQKDQEQKKIDKYYV